MKKIVLVFMMALFSSVAYADWGSMLKSVQSNPLITQQASVNNLITKVQSISSAFSQMPANSGKLDFLKAALPLLTKANTAAQTNPANVPQINGLLDQVKGLLAKKTSANPLTPSQIPQVTQQSQQLSGLLADLLKNEGAGLKGLVPPATAR
jgi:hypothetical protein